MIERLGELPCLVVLAHSDFQTVVRIDKRQVRPLAAGYDIHTKPAVVAVDIVFDEELSVARLDQTDSECVLHVEQDFVGSAIHVVQRVWIHPHLQGEITAKQVLQLILAQIALHALTRSGIELQ